MNLEVINESFSVCRVKSIHDINFNDQYVFIGKTDEEISLVCSTKYVPRTYIECENNWKAFRIQGVLDFSLIGILSRISKILADNEIGIFVISTYNTDYILIKDDEMPLAVKVLSKEGYTFI